jgi:hypothetical protein
MFLIFIIFLAGVKAVTIVEFVLIVPDADIVKVVVPAVYVTHLRP